MIPAFVFLFFFIFNSLVLADAPPVILEDKKDFYELGRHLDILEDPTGKITIDDVNSPEWASKFKRSEKKVPNFGFSKSAFWARLRVKNKTTDQKKWLLSQSYYLLDEIKFFKKIKGKWEVSVTGDTYPFSTREIKARSFTFSVKPKENSLYFIRTKGIPNQMVLSMKTPIKFASDESVNDLGAGLFFGLVAAMVAYNLFIYFSTKSLGYLFYVCYVIFYGLWLLSFQGLSQKFLFKEFPWMSNNGIVLLNGLTQLFICLFTISFLNLKKATPKLFKTAIFFCGTALFIMVSSLIFPYSINVKLYSINTLLGIVFIFSLAIYRIKMNYRPAKYFVLAFSFMFLGIIILYLLTRGFIPSTVLTRLASTIGNALELILLSMGLADKFNLIQENALKKEEEAKQLQENYAKDLEKEVTLKTKQVVMEKERAESSEKDVSELLHNMGQSVFSVNKEGYIIPPVSQYSFQLFGKSIDGRSVYETLFKDIDKEGEKFCKAKFAIEVSIGVDSLQYDISFDQLPNDVMMFNEKGEKRSLKVHYSSIVDKDNIVQKLMMIVEDVTEIEKLEREAKEVLEISEIKVKKLQEIVSNDKKDMRLFYREVGINLELAKSSMKNYDVEALFRAAHTIKGNARIYNLTGLSAEIHLIEGTINGLTKGDKNKENFESIYGLIKKSVENYINLSKEVFGDDVDETFLAGDVDEMIISKSLFLSSLDELKSISKNLDHTKLFKVLKKLENEEFKKYLSHLHKTVNKMAISLSKDIELKIEGDEIFLDLKMSSMIKDSLMHIIQNSADHGIVEKGIIKIVVQDLGVKMDITISDDGKGMDPEIIYQKGIEKELVMEKKSQTYSKKDKLNIILMAGFSTKKVATEFSGRGVGMDVVKSNIEKLKGTIEIDSAPGEGTVFKLSIPYQKD